jgi:hypothetical protein
MRMPNPGPLGETFFEAGRDRSGTSRKYSIRRGLVESVRTVDTPLFFPTDMLAPPRACSAGLRTRGVVLYRKIESTSFMQVFRRKVVISEMSPPTPLRTALGVIAVRGDLG